MRENFPEVVFWAAPRNDFLFSYNDFARASEAEIILLLNNDLKLKPGIHRAAGAAISWATTCLPSVRRRGTGMIVSTPAVHRA